MDYLTLFDTHTDYNTYITGEDALLPNVSYCNDNDDVHYNQLFEPRLICEYDVTDISSPTKLRAEPHYMQNQFKSMEIDGVLLDNLVINYQFTTTGKHIVKYELNSETQVGMGEPLFDETSPLVKVTIPRTANTIGSFAFSGCTFLTSITIPSSISSIGTRTFINCPNVTNIKVDDENTTYDSRDNCNAIIESATNTLIVGCKNTVIPNTVTTIGIDAFYLCKSLVNMTIPDSVTSIGAAAFSGCDNLTGITIPNSVININNAAFYGCSGLTTIRIGSGVTSIGASAFYGCSGLTSINCDNATAPSIQSDTFQGIKTDGTLTVPNGSIGYYAWMSTSEYYLGKYNWTMVEQ
jgi:hypothetical protein